MSIVVIGTVALDDVVTPFGRNLDAPGGSATYFSLSASNFTKVKLVAVAGSDFPKKYIELFGKKKIDTSGLEVKHGKTFRWKGKYSREMDNPETIATHLNLLESFNPVLPESHRNQNILFLANIDPDLQLKVLRQSNAKIIAADTMNFWIEHKRSIVMKVLKKVDILIINEHEARQLTKTRNILKAAKNIIQLGVKKVVIKKGEDGALFVSESGFFTCPAYLMEDVIDPTGAGDTFAGGLLGYLSQVKRFDDSAIKKALAYGAVMASFAVEVFDVRGLVELSKAGIEKRLNSFKKTCGF
jgi:sugar/nucleoside kinase (ribokinase family)